MDSGNPYHPTGNALADGFVARVEALREFVRAKTEASGPDAKRLAGEAVKNLELGGFWASRAFRSGDYVEGDDGGSGIGEPAARVEDEADLPPASA
jgi:hypothetical protein